MCKMFKVKENAKILEMNNFMTSRPVWLCNPRKKLKQKLTKNILINLFLSDYNMFVNSLF